VADYELLRMPLRDHPSWFAVCKRRDDAQIARADSFKPKRGCRHSRQENGVSHVRKQVGAQVEQVP